MDPLDAAAKLASSEGMWQIINKCGDSDICLMASCKSGLMTLVMSNAASRCTLDVIQLHDCECVIIHTRIPFSCRTSCTSSYFLYTGDALSPEERERLLRMGILTGLAIAIHNFPEGVATYVSATASTSLGTAMAIAIGLHNVCDHCTYLLLIACPVFSWGGINASYCLSFMLAQDKSLLLAYCECAETAASVLTDGFVPRTRSADSRGLLGGNAHLLCHPQQGKGSVLGDALRYAAHASCLSKHSGVFGAALSYSFCFALAVSWVRRLSPLARPWMDSSCTNFEARLCAQPLPPAPPPFLNDSCRAV